MFSNFISFPISGETNPKTIVGFKTKISILHCEWLVMVLGMYCKYVVRLSYANYEAKGQSRAMFYNNNRRFIVTNLSSLALSLKIVIVRLWDFLISIADKLFSRHEIHQFLTWVRPESPPQSHFNAVPWRWYVSFACL